MAWTRPLLRIHPGWPLAAAWLLAGAPAVCSSAEAPITVQGSAPYHLLAIPQAVQSASSSAQLPDVRVLNARGDALPFAWVEDVTTRSDESQEHTLPFFKAPAAAPAASSTTAAAVDASQQGGWIIDLRSLNAPITELQIDLPDTDNGIYSAALEASDDLQHWQSLRTQLQLVSLQQQGQRLQSGPIDLDGLRARYLRLRPVGGSLPPPVSGVRAMTLTHVAMPNPASALQWSAAIAPAACIVNACDYMLPSHLPLERLELVLNEPNTLARVQWLAQPEATGSTAPSRPRRHHHLRDHLRGYRDKSAPEPERNAAATGWQFIDEGPAYWLQLPQGELRSEPWRFSGEAHARLRLQVANGIAALGPQAPSIRLAWRPRALVFLARGPQPYVLHWGEAATSPGALPLAELMPQRRATDPWPEAAGLQLPMPVAQASARGIAPTGAASGIANTAAASAKPEAQGAGASTDAGGSGGISHKAGLWGILLLALAVMGGMAWTLLRPSAKAPPPAE